MGFLWMEKSCKQVILTESFGQPNHYQEDTETELCIIGLEFVCVYLFLYLCVYVYVCIFILYIYCNFWKKRVTIDVEMKHYVVVYLLKSDPI